MTDEKNKVLRLVDKDIFGEERIYKGLTKIKGVSWMVSNAILRKLGIDKEKKVKDLTEEEINQIKIFLEKMDIPSFLKNKRKERESGEDLHLISSELDLKTDFDIKRMKKIRNYKGMRHMAGQPVRGQRTKSHFRKNKNKSAGGIKRKKKDGGNKEKKEEL